MARNFDQETKTSNTQTRVKAQVPIEHGIHGYHRNSNKIILTDKVDTN